MFCSLHTTALGSVHTWCPDTSARTPAQNGVVFRHLVPNLKICSHSMNRGHAHCCKVVSKELGNQCKMCAHKYPVPSLVPEYKTRARAIMPKFWHEYLEKECVHIGTQLRIIPGHCA